MAATFDEMKIKSCLVFERNTGEIVGFTDLGDTELIFSSFNNELHVATTVIPFLVASLKFICAIFVLLDQQHPFKCSLYSGRLCRSTYIFCCGTFVVLQ